MRVNNVKDFPQIFYGLHFSEGCAEYREPDYTYRIFLNEDTVRKMDKSFAGKPVYVHHVDEVNLHNLQNEADGYVVESFRNAADGKTWCKFIVITDRAKECIKNGWRLSNSYIPKSFASGGEWHGISYEKEITDAEYEHLAIVDNPRYSESMILTPEQFKKYNEDKEKELLKIANSKGVKQMKFNFFKKTKVENSTDLENMLVTLPKSKLEISIEKLINDADEKETLGPKAYDKHLVMVGNEEMQIGELVKKHQDCKNELEALKKENEELKAKHQGEEKKEDVEMKNDDEIEKPEEKKENKEEKPEEKPEDKKDNKDEEDAEKKALEIEKKKNHYESLKNANKLPFDSIENSIMTSYDGMILGQKKYGSN